MFVAVFGLLLGACSPSEESIREQYDYPCELDYVPPADPDRLFVDPLGPLPDGNSQSEINYLCFLIADPTERTGEPLPLDDGANGFVGLGYDYCWDPDQATNWMLFQFRLIEEIVVKITVGALLYLCNDSGVPLT